MNKLIKLSTLILLSGFIFLYSCSGDDPFMEIADVQLNYNFEAIGGTKFATIKSNQDFTATSNQTWCYTEVYSGSRNNNLRISVDKNLNAEIRTAIITVTAEGLPETQIIVSQDASAPFISVTEKKVIISGDSLEFSLEISANTLFAYELPKWIHPKANNVPSVGKNIYGFVADILSTGERSGDITIKAVDQSLQITPVVIPATQSAALLKEFQGGDGTQGNPYLIATPQQLENMRKYTAINDGSASISIKYFKLIADIDLASVSNWIPLSANEAGESQSYGYMHLDGDAHIIKNMTSKYPGPGSTGTVTSGYWGFAGILCGSIKNIGFVNVDVQSADAGPIAGAVGRGTPAVGSEALQRGIIENCFVTGKVSGAARIGGVAGQIGAKGSYIKNCYSTCDVTNMATTGTTNYTGGVVGVVAGSDANNAIAVSYVENCYATGNIASQTGRAGGVLGMANGGAIKNGVSFNKSITMTSASDPFGTIAGFIHTVSAPLCTGSYIAKDNITMMRGGSAYIPVNFDVLAGYPIDGKIKDDVTLSSAVTYFTLGFSGSIWSLNLVNNIYPQLLWVSERSDAADIDGL